MTIKARIKTSHPDHPGYTTTTLEVAAGGQARGDSRRPLVYIVDSRTGTTMQLRTTQAAALRDSLSEVLEETD